jgi:hypothetical protein
MSKGYEPHFDLDLEFGQVYEKKLQDLLTEKGRIEVKTDRMAHSTGNIVVEFESRGKPSGIATTKADYWCFWIEQTGVGIFIPTEKLRTIAEKCRVVAGGDKDKEGKPTSKMYLVSLEKILK